ncbi:TonB-linked SusC/RagA family outer membrane protein [Larkinella arboricola]|uniref:TonB-linked SusC/RagA family outer membrane protein n=1 Tax=Larkinella arboricola TaxID=643671 RepID=A0A327X5J3_LARAB|nr:TonB-dependent receptor [Larkinella arboricola]RAK01929.1 TonB-linked SusC/RagA family outer membrane protein [Larkinella arboricola]
MEKLRQPLSLLRSFMKLTFYQLLLAAVFTGLALARPVEAQRIMDQRVTIQVTNQPVRAVLNQLGKQTDVRFAFRSSLIQLNQRVTFSATNQPLGEILDKLLKPLDLSYQVKGRQIILNLEPRPLPSPEEILRRSDAAAVDQTITGTVADETGARLPGVSVVVKGTSRGTTTDGNGQYRMTLQTGDAVLVFSFVGYTSQEIAVDNRSEINVSLVTDTKNLSEVVVVGYGTQKRSDLTGSVSSVKAAEVKNLPVRSVNEALQGRAAGVQVTRPDGTPGGSSDIVIRGVGSIGGMAPLYIVDGIRMGAGNNFNLQDVESIEVLKDASAAAIYGAQAAGGVVLVTTKRGGSLDKMNINFNAYYGVRQPRNLYKMLNTADYITAKKAFGVNTNGWGDPASLPNTDWVDEIFQNGKEQSYSLSLAGASAKANYYLSANYQREDGTIIDNSFERYGLRSNADFKINKRFKVGETLFAWKTSTNPPQNTTFPFRSAPLIAVRDETNPYGGWAKTGSFFTGPNLVGWENSHHRLNDQYALEGNLYADWEITKGLNLRSTFGASIYSGRNYTFRESHDFGVVRNPIAYLSREQTSQRNLTANFVLTYDKTVGQHEFKAMAGYEAFQQDLSNLYAEAQGFQIITYNLGLSTDPSTYRASGGEYPQTRLLSQFGRINYTYAGKYLLTANVRRDGSDRFGPANRWGVFPSFSVGWRVSDEAFMRNIPVISTLKLRGSYGKLGSTSNIPQFTYQASYGGSGGTNIHGLPDGSRAKGYALTAQLPNENIKWEEVRQTDIGADIGLFNNQLNLVIDWYSRQTGDMIYQVPVPRSAGFAGSNVYTNIGQMSNKGLELALDYRGKKGGFTYSIAANAAFNKNLVKQLSGTNNNPINDGSGGDYLESTIARTQAGYPLSQYYGYVTEGIFQSDAEVATLNQQAQEKAAAAGRPTTGVFYQNAGTGAGDLRFRDTNGDGRITIDDKTYIGSPWPKMTYGLTLNLGWKGFDLSALFQGVQGLDIYNANRYYTQFFVGDYNTTGDIFETSFFNGNGLTDRPRVGYTDASGNYIRDPNSNYTRISDYYVENGSYLKLRNLQIGYTIPNTVTSKIKMSSIRVYAQGQNLMTLTKYTGMDPEVLGRNGTTGRGIDAIYSYPRTTLLSLGIDASF